MTAILLMQVKLPYLYILW